MTVELPGVDLDRLTEWMDETRPGLRRGALSGEVIAGGKSNLTFRIVDDDTAWALRRPPLAHVLPTAHDMVREYRVTSALAATDVPVAHPVALCEDEAVLGARFYLMDFVDGLVLDKADVVDKITTPDAARVCETLVDTLATLHEVEPASIGLAEFGRPEGFLGRQLKRWRGQWDASETRHLDALQPVIDLLERTMPEQTAPAIVHGDYRMTNVMFAPAFDRIAAVVDWEMATIGDPLTDVGLLVVYQRLAQAGDDQAMPQLSVERGFATADEMVQRYAARSPRSLADLSWYVGFGYFKLAVVGEGIHHRYLAGKTVGEGFEHFGEFAPRLLAAALDELAGR